MKRRGVTLVEVLVVAGLFAMVMTAVLSFYIEAMAVSAKKDQNSERLRRFHLGLEKMEQLLREGKIVDLRTRSILFLKLSDQVENSGFPSYDLAPAQLASTEKGVILIQDDMVKPLLPTEEGEHVIFTWVHEDPNGQPPPPPQKTTLNIALYYSGGGERSGLFFHRTLNVHDY